MLGRATCGGAFITILRIRVRTVDPNVKQLARQCEWTALPPLGTLFACLTSSAFHSFRGAWTVAGKPFHLAWFLQGSSAQAWGEAWTGHIGQNWMEPELYLKNAIAVPRQDPSVVAALMTQVTSRIGIVPTFGTYAYHPYLLARLVATLDQVSAGRIGWNAVTGSSDFAAMNFGMDGMPEHDLRYDMADEYMKAVRGLWGSWEPDAIIADRKSGVLVDHTKVHGVNYEGKY